MNNITEKSKKVYELKTDANDKKGTDSWAKANKKASQAEHELTKMINSEVNRLLDEKFHVRVILYPGKK